VETPVTKLKLNVEDLALESFEVPSVEMTRGTVQGAVAAEVSAACSQYCGTTLADYIWNRTWLQ
jgi:hypothetical protein